MKITKTNYVDLAEEVIDKKIRRNKKGKIELTTNKIRNILSIAATIYDQVKMEKGPLTEDEIADVMYLKMKLVYESGREDIVRNFVDESKLLDYIKEIGDNRESLILYCKYIEALVAYHRYYGEKDNKRWIICTEN